mmetsp:Transcript_101284/g.264118  ORF Transcript_101284/g.264118 Transcript_101284/m.264118 type:complete len:325 (+) Transcript_101284:116-1090(+)
MVWKTGRRPRCAAQTGLPAPHMFSSCSPASTAAASTSAAAPAASASAAASAAAAASSAAASAGAASAGAASAGGSASPPWSPSSLQHLSWHTVPSLGPLQAAGVAQSHSQASSGSAATGSRPPPLFAGVIPTSKQHCCQQQLWSTELASHAPGVWAHLHWHLQPPSGDGACPAGGGVVWSPSPTPAGPFGSMPPAVPISMTAWMASWSLPPSPRFLVPITDEGGVLLNMLSMPPHIAPLKICTKYCDNPLTVSEAGAALKSPTTIIASPSTAFAVITRIRLAAVTFPPHLPPVSTGSGPWWFMKNRNLLVAMCFSRTHCAFRVP